MRKQCGRARFIPLRHPFRAPLCAAGLALLTWTAHNGFWLSVAQASPAAATSPSPAPGSGIALAAGSQALLAEEVSRQFYVLNAAKSYLTGASLAPLSGMITEISAGHQAHVSTLQQLMGSSAPATPAVQNLDAGSLSQFVSMAETLEDIDVSLHQGVLVTALQGGAAAPASGTSTVTAANSSGPAMDAAEVAILADDARYDAGIRAFEKIASTADAGNPNTTLTQSGTPLSAGFTFAQAQAALQHFIAGSAPGAVGAPLTVSFSKDILPIFTNNGAKSCAQAGCHGGPKALLGLNLAGGDAAAGLINVPSLEKPSVLRVKPGDSANSYLYQKIAGAAGMPGKLMPLIGGPLAAGDVDLIRQWIDAGAPNN